MRIGAPVAVFDVDPAHIGTVCCRFLGFSSSKLLSYDECKVVISSFIPQSARDSGFDIRGILTSLNIEPNTFVDVTTLMRKIFFNREKYVSACDRVLSGHSCSIVAISFLSSSNLLVTTDSDGLCCVWDPCSKQNFVGANEFSTAALGLFAYSLVARLDPTSYVPHKLRVKSVNIVGADINERSSIPTPNDKILKAFAVDKKFKISDVLVRGFFYVLTDMSVFSIESKAFDINLVTLEYSNLMVQLFSEYERDERSKFCEVFQNRGKIVRVVYVVSCSHKTLSLLKKDLQQFGVFQKGYTETPSELIGIACFERHSKCMFAKSLSATPVTRIDSGIVLSISEGEVRVGLDVSNDIIRTKANSLQTLFDRLGKVDHMANKKMREGDLVEAKFGGKEKWYPGTISHDYGDGTYDILYDDGESEKKIKENLIHVTKRVARDSLSSIGAHVVLNSEVKPDPPFGDNISCESIVLSAECREGVSLVQYIFSVTVGRSSIPVPAALSDAPLSSDDFYRLRDSYLSFNNMAFGKAAAHHMCLQRSRASRLNSMQVQRATVLSTVFAENPPHPSQSLLPLYSFLGSSDSGTKVGLIRLLVELVKFGAPPSHPLISYLSEYVSVGDGKISAAAESWYILSHIYYYSLFNDVKILGSPTNRYLRKIFIASFVVK